MKDTLRNSLLKKERRKGVIKLYNLSSGSSQRVDLESYHFFSNIVYLCATGPLDKLVKEKYLNRPESSSVGILLAIVTNLLKIHRIEKEITKWFICLT